MCVRLEKGKFLYRSADNKAIRLFLIEHEQHFSRHLFFFRLFCCLKQPFIGVEREKQRKLSQTSHQTDEHNSQSRRLRTNIASGEKTQPRDYSCQGCDFPLDVSVPSSTSRFCSSAPLRNRAGTG